MAGEIPKINIPALTPKNAEARSNYASPRPSSRATGGHIPSPDELQQLIDNARDSGKRLDRGSILNIVA